MMNIKENNSSMSLPTTTLTLGRMSALLRCQQMWLKDRLRWLASFCFLMIICVEKRCCLDALAERVDVMKLILSWLWDELDDEDLYQWFKVGPVVVPHTDELTIRETESESKVFTTLVILFVSVIESMRTEGWSWTDLSDSVLMALN